MADSENRSPVRALRCSTKIDLKAARLFGLELGLIVLVEALQRLYERRATPRHVAGEVL